MSISLGRNGVTGSKVWHISQVIIQGFIQTVLAKLHLPFRRESKKDLDPDQATRIVPPYLRRLLCASDGGWQAYIAQSQNFSL